MLSWFMQEYHTVPACYMLKWQEWHRCLVLWDGGILVYWPLGDVAVFSVNSKLQGQISWAFPVKLPSGEGLTGSGNGLVPSSTKLVPSSTKLLPEPMLTQIYVAIACFLWRHQSTVCYSLTSMKPSQRMAGRCIVHFAFWRIRIVPLFRMSSN